MIRKWKTKKIEKMWQFIKNRMMNWMKELFWSIIHSLPPVDSRGSYCNSFVYEKEIRQFFKIKQMKESISNWEIIIIMTVRKKRRARVITQIKFRTTTTTMTTLKTMTMMTTNLEPWVASVCDVLSSSSFFHDKWQSKSGPIRAECWRHGARCWEHLKIYPPQLHTSWPDHPV